MHNKTNKQSIREFTNLSFRKLISLFTNQTYCREAKFNQPLEVYGYPKGCPISGLPLDTYLINFLSSIHQSLGENL